jgi:hypothetical protein
MEQLLAFLLTFTPPSHIDLGKQVAQEVHEVVSSGGALINLSEEQTEKLLLLWSWYESKWDPATVGDSGRSIGVMQVNVNHLKAHGYISSEVKNSRKLGLEIGLVVMKEAIVLCRDHKNLIRAGMGMYSTGRCGGAPELVTWRLKMAGLGAFESSSLRPSKIIKTPPCFKILILKEILRDLVSLLSKRKVDARQLVFDQKSVLGWMQPIL